MIASLMPMNFPRSLSDTMSEMLGLDSQEKNAYNNAFTYMIKVIVMIASCVFNKPHRKEDGKATHLPRRYPGMP